MKQGYDYFAYAVRTDGKSITTDKYPTPKGARGAALRSSPETEKEYLR